MPTWLLWTGAGQKAKHRLSSSLIFWGALTRTASPALSCRALEMVLMFWEVKTLPRRDVVPFARVVCLTCCCHVLKEGSSLLLGQYLYPLYCCSVNKDLPLCIGGACASVRRAGRSAWRVLG